MAGAHPPQPPVFGKTNSYTIVPQGALGVSRERVLNKCVIIKDEGNNEGGTTSERQQGGLPGGNL